MEYKQIEGPALASHTPPPHVCKTAQQHRARRFLLRPTTLPRALAQPRRLAALGYEQWWAVLWHFAIVFHARTLSDPHPLPRQCPFAKCPSSFSHIFSVFIYFCFLLPSTAIWCFHKQKLVILSPSFLPSGAPVLYLIFLRPRFLCSVIFHF